MWIITITMHESNVNTVMVIVKTCLLYRHITVGIVLTLMGLISKVSYYIKAEKENERAIHLSVLCCWLLVKPLCFSVPCLGGAKHLAVTAIQSDKVCVCVCRSLCVPVLICVYSQLSVNQREREREWGHGMTGWLDAQTVPSCQPNKTQESPSRTRRHDRRI